jgi:hypothetical protein
MDKISAKLTVYSEQKKGFFLVQVIHIFSRTFVREHTLQMQKHGHIP